MKKKGFTLIELLAVIVVLAIIALIATPLVLKYIEKSRIESTKVSTASIRDAALNYVATEQLKGNIEYPVIVDVNDLDFKGKESYAGKVVIYKDGTVEEFVNNKDYVISNGQITNKKEPYLKVKDGQTGIIDNKRNYVYSFYNCDDYRLYRTKLTEDVLNSFFEVTNGGTLEYQGNIYGSTPVYGTGSKIIVKDKEDNIVKEYQIVIFGDVIGNGVLYGGNQLTIIIDMVNNSSKYDEIYRFAGDVNFDGIIDDNDRILYRTFAQGRKIDQITRKILN